MPTGYGLPSNDIRDSDPDVQGMVGLQENRMAFTGNGPNLQSPTSAYSAEEYVHSGFQSLAAEANMF